MSKAFHNKHILIILITIIVLVIIGLFTYKESSKLTNNSSDVNYLTNTPSQSNKGPIVENSLVNKFTLQESDNSLNNKTEWILNSGGKVYIVDNIIKTIQGELPTKDIWRTKYYNNNPSETDNGYHPQNIFRLITKNKFTNFTQSMYFKINKYNLSSDSHRTSSNGILFFERYYDANNLYYAGIRVDGYAVIKKKINGSYFTLSYTPIYNKSKYERNTNPNLIPIDKWVGIKTEIANVDNEKIHIKLFIDKNETNKWELITESIDDGKSYGGKSLFNSGSGGIRSDFIDLEFKNYFSKENTD